MMLYHWPSSEVMMQYGHGHMIALASSIEEARDIIRKGFNAYARSDKFHSYSLFDSDGMPWDDDDAETFAKMLQTLERDLAQEPVVGEASIFIRGSE